MKRFCTLHNYTLYIFLLLSCLICDELSKPTIENSFRTSSVLCFCLSFLLFVSKVLVILIQLDLSVWPYLATLRNNKIKLYGIVS